ncbi:membrane protein [Arthrobacter phage Qui]|uniref:Membrane protein n=1 Tax=Arthrobacter phage Qui TaxID=2603260 RepID=A0A5B8WPE1_9CAUD|nr:membrane protein [Arthrobacter phage Qui]QED11538.1 membrane protein [Arthrobacter phage Qui]QOC56370.1 membrane protein [Arthrobacter phage Paella]
MFTKNKPEEDRPELEEAITKALLELKDHQPYSTEYIKALEQIEKLYKLRAPKPELQKPVSLDTVLTVAGNIAGIVIILGYERAHVITSKAFSLIIKPR